MMHLRCPQRMNLNIQSYFLRRPLLYTTPLHCMCTTGDVNLPVHTNTHTPAHVCQATVELLPFSASPGPTGIKSIPYIGTALIFKQGNYSVDTFFDLVTENFNRYGPIFKMRLGRHYTVFTENVQDVELIFRTEGKYPRRRLLGLLKTYRERNGLPLGLGTTSGSEWWQLRKPINPLLNTPQVCLQYLPSQNLVADDLIHKLCDVSMSPEDHRELFFRYAAESVGVVCFNQRLGFLSHQSKMHRLMDAVKTSMSGNYKDLVGLEWKYKYNKNDRFYQSYARAQKVISEDARHYIELVRRELDSSPPTQLNEESSLTFSSNNILTSLIRTSGLEMEQIVAVIENLLVTGTDSTARNLPVVLYNLAIHPQQQLQAAEEVLAVCGADSPLTASALSKMHYLKACVKESMRVDFPTSNGTMRILSQDTVLGGYLVPKDTNVIMSIRRIVKNPDYFQTPEEYIPERWLRKPANLTDGLSNECQKASRAPPFSFLPFGHGVRSCVGRRFAEMEIYVAVAKILQKLKIKIDDKYEGLDPVYTPFITPRRPIPFIFEKR